MISQNGFFRQPAPGLRWKIFPDDSRNDFFYLFSLIHYGWCFTSGWSCTIYFPGTKFSTGEIKANRRIGKWCGLYSWHASESIRAGTLKSDYSKKSIFLIPKGCNYYRKELMFFSKTLKGWNFTPSGFKILPDDVSIIMSAFQAFLILMCLPCRKCSQIFPISSILLNLFRLKSLPTSVLKW